VSTGGWIVVGLLAAAVVLVAWRALRVEARLRTAERRITALDAEVRERLAPDLADVRSQARAAASEARKAARAAGVEEDPPRLAWEPVTGPIVKALAFGAGASRAVARLAGRGKHRGTRR
jgi:hypothetical protein